MESFFGKYNIYAIIEVINYPIIFRTMTLEMINTSIFSELINMAVPDTIDNRAINKTKNGKISLFKKHENLTLAINSAKVLSYNILQPKSIFEKMK